MLFIGIRVFARNIVKLLLKWLFLFLTTINAAKPFWTIRSHTTKWRGVVCGLCDQMIETVVTSFDALGTTFLIAYDVQSFEYLERETLCCIKKDPFCGALALCMDRYNGPVWPIWFSSIHHLLTVKMFVCHVNELPFLSFRNMIVR